MTSKLLLKPIKDILDNKFYIPDYQRGYRWTTTQVEDLLNDIYAFKKAREGDFYCLQPIVVKLKENNDWEVIDGQQRLTTIYLILKYLKQKELFTVTYETRPDSEKFLQTISEDRSKSDDNIDFFHMLQAYEVIEKWFESSSKELKDFLDNLLRHTKFIWYEVDAEKDSIEIFTRINMGKIPLTNAELIKALFLSKADSGEKYSQQLEIARKWDEIEQTLQEDDFGYFIANKDDSKKYETRIEYIFDLMKNQKNHPDPFYTFIQFQECMNGEDKIIDSLWMEIKEYFQSFQDWYEDKECYHYIGYLLASGVKLIEVIGELEKKPTKTDFKKKLKDMIKNNLEKDLKKKEIGDLSYDEDKPVIRKILLLFNIETLVTNKTSNAKFPFDLYKKDKWDIEHIHSLSDKEPSCDQKRKWLPILNGKYKKEVVTKLDDSLVDEHYTSEIKDLYTSGKSNEIDDSHHISNLTLLDSNTNRSYKNIPFPLKRKRILQEDKEGKFIPLVTRNIFLKAYNSEVNQPLSWTKQDAEGYLKAMQELLKEFIS